MDGFEVFLSHNSKNKAEVRELFSALIERGLRPWLDEEHLIPGRRWQDELERIIAEIPAAAVLVGRDGIGPWEDVEMRAILLEFQDRKLPIIPVLLPGAPQQPKLPLFLRPFTWVDLRDGLTEEGIDRLVWGITGKRPQRTASPRPPSPAARTEEARQAEAPKVGGPIVGIDLGTTRSTVAVMNGAGAVVIAREGDRATPSVVAFVPGGERLVGQVARRQAVTHPMGTIRSIKRLMGRKHSEVGEELKRAPCPLESAENGDACVAIEGRRYSPPEISAMILGELKQAAEDYLGEKVERAVITVPSCFNAAQREATRSAARIAGLEVVRLVNEAAAAALAYGFHHKKAQTIAVYDFGGGSFDISILEVGEGVVEVKATDGDAHLGGDDMDRRIIEWLLEESKKDQGIDLGNDPMAMQRLQEAAEKAKIELSTARETEVNLPFITADASGPKHLKLRLARPKLEQLVDDLIQKSVGLCRQALKDAGVQPEDIDEVVLVGGQTRMPAIRKRVKDVFGREPHEGVNPDEVVALGAAIQGGVLRGDVKDMLLLDVTPLTLGIETLGGVFTKIIERNTTIPTRKSEIFSTSEDNQTSFEVHVLEGEREMARDNRTLGTFDLVGIPAAPRGMPQIEVAFVIDADGIVSVSAKDLGTGKEQQVTIGSTSGLAEGEGRAERPRQGALRRNLPAVAR